MQQSNSSIDKHIFDDTCQSLSYHLNKAKTTYYCNRVDEAKGDQRELFKITKSLLGDTGESPLPDSNSAPELAETFSDYFINKIVTIRTKLQSINSQSPPLSLIQLNDWEPEFQGEKLTAFTPKYEEEI